MTTAQHVWNVSVTKTLIRPHTTHTHTHTLDLVPRLYCAFRTAGGLFPQHSTNQGVSFRAIGCKPVALRRSAMARRRGKNSSKQDDSWLPLEPPAGQSSRGFSGYVIPGVLLLIVAVGGSGLGWVCSDHQHTIESLSETLASMQARITKLQQQLGTDNAQVGSLESLFCL